MKPEYYQPIWVKAVLGFVLFMFGLLCTFLVFRFIPITKQEGIDGLGGLKIALFCLAGFELSYILGVVLKRNHPYVVFAVNMIGYIIVLLLVRFLHIGW